MYPGESKVGDVISVSLERVVAPPAEEGGGQKRGKKATLQNPGRSVHLKWLPRAENLILS